MLVVIFRLFEESKPHIVFDVSKYEVIPSWCITIKFRMLNKKC